MTRTLDAKKSGKKTTDSARNRQSLSKWYLADAVSFLAIVNNERK